LSSWVGGNKGLKTAVHNGRYSVEFTIANLSELGKTKRIDAEFYQSQYVIDFSAGHWEALGPMLVQCQYGLSMAMSEERRGYPIFRMDNIKRNFLSDDDLKYVEIPKPLFEQFKLQKNDLLFNRVNAENFVGRTGIFKLDGNYLFASYLIRLRLRKNADILPDYLNVFLSTRYGQKQIHKFARRAVNQANVNAEELKCFMICVPSSAFQERIRRLSNDAWKCIKKAKTLYKLAEWTLLNTLGLTNWKLPTKKIVVGTVELEEEENTAICNQLEVLNAARLDAEYFQPGSSAIVNQLIRCEFKLVPLLTLADRVDATFDPSKQPEDLFRYVALADINSTAGIIEGFTELRGKDAPSRARRVLSENDIIISSVEGSLEKAALVDKNFGGALASTGFIQLRARQIKPEVLLVLSRSMVMQTQLKRECTGTILTAVPENALSKILLPLIDDGVQKKIAVYVQRSHRAGEKGMNLLETAKTAVERCIEKGETAGIQYLAELATLEPETASRNKA
jgi:type I restriction enzyme S subunit